MKLKTMLFFVVSTLISTAAFAKPADAKFYMLMDDGGEHPVEKCEVKTKLPKKLKKQKLISDVKSYLGTEQTEFASKNEAGIDMYNHYFSDEADCMATLKKFNN